jgi:hypothetical protein
MFETFVNPEIIKFVSGLQMTTPVGNSTFYYSPPSSSSTQQQQSKLMPLYSNTTSQLLHQPVEMKQQKPVDPFQNLWQEAKSNLTYWKLSNQQQCVVENSLLLSKSNQQPSTSSRSDEIAKSTSAIIPIRPAPPPPSMSIDDDTVTNEYNRHNDIEVSICVNLIRISLILTTILFLFSFILLNIHSMLKIRINYQLSKVKQLPFIRNMIKMAMLIGGLLKTIRMQPMHSVMYRLTISDRYYEMIQLMLLESPSQSAINLGYIYLILHNSK